MLITKKAAPPKGAAAIEEPEPAKSYPIARPAAIDAAGAAIAGIITDAERRILGALWLHSGETLDGMAEAGAAAPRFFTPGLHRELARVLATRPDGEPMDLALVLRVLNEVASLPVGFDELAETLQRPCGVRQVVAYGRLLRVSAILRRAVAAWWHSALDVGAFDAERVQTEARTPAVRFTKPRKQGAA